MIQGVKELKVCSVARHEIFHGHFSVFESAAALDHSQEMGPRRSVPWCTVDARTACGQEVESADLHRQQW